MSTAETTADLLPLLSAGILENQLLAGPYQWWRGSHRNTGRPGLANRLSSIWTRFRALSDSSSRPRARAGADGVDYTILPSLPKTGRWYGKCVSCYPVSGPGEVTVDFESGDMPEFPLAPGLVLQVAENSLLVLLLTLLRSPCRRIQR